MKQDRYIDQWVAKVREDPKRLATWRQYCTWADPVMQWAQIYVPHMFKVPLAPVHSEILGLWRQVMFGRLPDDKTRGVVAMPRTMAKTTTTGQLGTLYFACEAPKLTKVRNGRGDVLYEERYIPRGHKDHDYLYLTGSEFLAKKTIAPVIGELQSNSRILADYGDLIESTSEGLEVKLTNGLWLIARGMGSRIRGLHPARLGGDDLEDRDNISNEDTRARFWSEWEDTVDFMMMEGTYSFYIGNYLDFFCALKRIGKLPASMEKVISALVKGKDGNWQSVWPEMWPTDRLLREWEEKGDAFLCEKMNNPLTESQSPIRMEEIGYYKREDIYRAVA